MLDGSINGFQIPGTQGPPGKSAVVIADVMATGNVVLSGIQTLDGTPGFDGMIAFLPNQAVLSQNGPWVMHSGAWVRYQPVNTWASMIGLAVVVVGGASQAMTWWYSLANKGGTIDQTALSFVSQSQLVATSLDARITALEHLVAPVMIPVADADFTVSPTAHFLEFTSLTATRRVFLPPVASFGADFPVTVIDGSGNASLAIKITFVPTSPNTIAGFTSVSIETANGMIRLRGDSSNMWAMSI